MGIGKKTWTNNPSYSISDLLARHIKYSFLPAADCLSTNILCHHPFQENLWGARSILLWGFLFQLKQQYRLFVEPFLRGCCTCRTVISYVFTLTLGCLKIIGWHFPAVWGTASCLLCTLGLSSETWQYLALFWTGGREGDSRTHPVSVWGQMCFLQQSNPPGSTKLRFPIVFSRGIY